MSRDGMNAGGHEDLQEPPCLSGNLMSPPIFVETS